MSLSTDITHLQVTSQTATVSQQGFGTPLLAVAKVPAGWGSARVRGFSSAAAVLAAGFLTSDPAYRMAEAAFAQEPAPATVKIGRRVNAFAQEVTLVPSAPAVGTVYSVRVGTIARIVGTGTFPLPVTPGGTLTVTPDGGAPLTATFNAAAALLSNNNGTANLTSAATALDHLDLSVNGTPLAPIAFDGTENTPAEYLSRISAGLGAVATMALTTGNGFTITTARRGTSASVTVLGSSSAALLTILGLLSGQTISGTGNVANAASVTALEYEAVMAAALGTAAMAAALGGHPAAQGAEGVSVRIGGTARADFGFSAALLAAGTAVATFTASTTDLADACNGLAAAINALTTDVDADASSGTEVVCTTQTEGRLVRFDQVSDALALRDTTADPGVEADLAALLAADADWYGLVLDSNGADEVMAAAGWCQTNKKLLVAQSADTGCGDPAETTDVLSMLRDAAMTRTVAFYYPALAGEWPSAAVLGSRMPVAPGSDTWAFKRLLGVTALPIPTTAYEAVVSTDERPAKNGNVYAEAEGTAFVYPGMTSGGEWADLVRGLDWLRSRLRAADMAVNLANEKIAFSDEGIRLKVAAVYGVLAEGVAVGLLAADPKPTATAPLAKNVPQAKRAARRLPDVNFTARANGAIQSADITGTVSA